MTDLSSDEDKSAMAEMAADLFQAKMDAKEATRGMTHLLKIGQFHLELVPDKSIDVTKVIKEILSDLHDRYGDAILLDKNVLLGMQQGNMHG
jgi:hypothetical protein